MALQAGVIDISLSPPNQTTSPTMGPVGALEHLIDGQVTRYEPQYGGATGVTPAKIECSQRDAFQSLPTTAKSAVDGQAESPPWTPAEALGSSGAQLVSICNAQPRVFTGTDWRTYPGARVLTNQLSQDVLYTSQKVIQVPDSAWLSGVTCSVWTESTTISTGAITTSYVGFKADGGAWVITPTVLYASADVTQRTLAKVVTDGTNFFVFYSVLGVIHINVYNTAGHLLGATSGGTLIGTHGGSWDIIAAVTTSPAGTVLFAQCQSSVADSGMDLISVGWSGSAVTVNANLDATIKGAGRVSFLTNDLGNGRSYIATLDSTDDVWAYEIIGLSQSNEYGPILSIATDVNSLDTITGFADPESDGVDVVVSIGLLPATGSPPANGPPVDPQLRYLVTKSCDRSNNVALLRITQSLCQVSRAFKLDDEYYVFAYYQSGSGIGLLPKTLAVTHTAGDYMIGAPVQPLTVAPGDQAAGSPIVTTANPAAVGGGAGATVNVTDAQSTSNTILAGDAVTVVTASGMGGDGIPNGTSILRWSLANRTAVNISGSRLTIAGASGNNATFDVIFGSSATAGAVFYTPTTDRFGNPFGAVTFTAAGTFTFISMTGYGLADLSSVITSDVIASFYAGASLVVSGGSTGDGTFTAVRFATSAASYPAYAGMNPLYAFASTTKIWAVTTSQTAGGANFAATITNTSNNEWFFANALFDSTYVGADLVVSSDAAVPANVGTFPITAVTLPTSVTTGGATSLAPQVFGFPPPVISINVLPPQVAYTFKLQALSLDYTYQNALVSVQGADPTNNGVYQITQINADGTFVTLPVNGLSNQFNEAFTGSQTITIFFAQNIQPEFQPTWFVVPLEGTQPVVGRFEYALAYADWRIEIDPTNGPNLFPMAVTSPVVTTLGRQVVLPYRAQNVTAATLETTPAGEVNIVAESFISTVGLKLFTLENTHGKPFATNGELSIPGPMAVVFTPSGFLEDGQNLAPEAPFLVSQSVASSGQLGITLGAVRFIVAVLEFTDENGNRTYSPPSPALQVNMSGTNNVATYGGRLPYPLSSTGGPVAGSFGPTTRLSGISLYATAFINGVPTTQHYKLTNDLNVNGLAPLTTLNPSGFSFPNSFTWNYVDQNPDAGLNANEILYTDKSLLPRYPAPAGPSGPRTWKNREWIIGYDDAVWMSGEKTEGDAVWYNPAFRFPFPAEDAPLAVSGMDDYLIVTCEASVWYIPAAQFPDATGGNGGLPTPVRLPFPNGSRNGFAETIREGVAYDSTDGGVWLVTRQLENKWLSHPLLATIGNTPVVGMTVDQGQRLFVLLSGSLTLCVYDGIPQCWYEWKMPSQGLLLATFNGQAVYEDSALVVPVVPGATSDNLAGVVTGIAGPDVSTQELNIGGTRGLKKVWEFQGVGTYRGPHNANAVLTYPEDGWPTSNYAITPTSLTPYVLPFNPNPEDASTYKVRIYPDFSGIVSPGATFSIEMVSAQVGVEPVGLNKLPGYLVMKGK